MGKKLLKLCLIKDEKIVASLDAVLEYDESNELDEGEIKFIHPLTGELQETPKQCLQGWSEQLEKENEYRCTLVEMIQEEQDLLQRAWDVDKCYPITYYL